jgi:hypothetical protein
MCGFGYKTGWLAVRNGAAAEMFAALGCRSVGRVGWLEGVERAYRDGDVVVATPPLAGGWMLVMGQWVASRADSPGVDVAALSATLGREVQLFVSHRVVDLHRWDRAVDGTLVRSFEYLGEAGEVTRWYGTPDETELAIGLPPRIALTDEVSVREDDVMRVAGAWSVDPQSLEGRPAPGALHLGRFPTRTPAPELQRPVQVVNITDLIIGDLSVAEMNERIEQRVATGRSYHLDPGTSQEL